MSLREGCGVYGVGTESQEAFPYLYWGMVAQNHRGHQSYGFATYNNGIEKPTSHEMGGRLLKAIKILVPD